MLITVTASSHRQTHTVSWHCKYLGVPHNKRIHDTVSISIRSIKDPHPPTEEICDVRRGGGVKFTSDVGRGGGEMRI